ARRSSNRSDGGPYGGADFAGDVRHRTAEPPVSAKSGSLNHRPHNQRGRYHTVELSHLSAPHPLGEHLIDNVHPGCAAIVALEPDVLLKHQKPGTIPFLIEIAANKPDHYRDLFAGRTGFSLHAVQLRGQGGVVIGVEAGYQLFLVRVIPI